eukprot:scaffold268833_cov19-Tisochrysis_lutea.AAC.1
MGASGAGRWWACCELAQRHVPPPTPHAPPHTPYDGCGPQIHQECHRVHGVLTAALWEPQGKAHPVAAPARAWLAKIEAGKGVAEGA